MLGVSFCAGATAQAADQQWSGATNTAFGNAGNWLGGVAPVFSNNDKALFYAASYTNQPTMGNGTNVYGLVFGDGSNASGAVTITTATLTNKFKLSSGGILMNAAAGAVQIGNGTNQGVFLSASQTWTNDSSSLLTSLNTVTNLNNSSPFTLTIAGGGTGGVTFSGPITDAGSVGTITLVIDTTAGTTTLNNSGNTYTGGTTINRGTLTMGANAALGTSGALAVNNTTTGAGTASVLNLASGVNTSVGSLSGTIATPSSGANTATINTQAGRTFSVNQTSGGIFEGVIAGGGNFALGSSSTSTLTLTGNNSYTGSTTISAGILQVGNGADVGSISSTSGVTNNGALVYNVGSGTRNLSFAIGGTGTFAQNSAGGTLTLAGDNTYSGGTTISAGTLKVGNATALGDSAGTVDVADGAVLDLNGTSMTATNALTLNGTGVSSGGALTNSSGTGATYAGLLSLGSASSIVASSGNITLSHAGAITGSGYRLTVGGAKDTTIASAISTGTGGLTKSGSGTLTLSGVSDFTGDTHVTAGGLKVNGSLVSAVSMDSGTTLSGTGTFTGDVTISGIHSPGNSPGIQTFNNLTYNSGAALNWELSANSATQAANPNAVFDQIIVNGTLDFAGATTINLSFDGPGSTVTWSDPFWSGTHSWQVYTSAELLGFSSNVAVADADWTDSASHTFASSLAGGSFSLGAVGSSIYLSYTPASAIPEPSTYAVLVGLGVLGCAYCIRRRRSTAKPGVP